jgi:hypothetical protein
MRKIWLITILLLLASHLGAESCWYPYVEGVGWAGSWWEGGGGRLFVPLWKNATSLTFAEAQLLGFRDEAAFSAGGGYRRLFCPTVAVGLAAMFDYARYYRHHCRSLYQGTASGELFWRCFELRANGYLCRHNITSQEVNPTISGVIVGTQLLRVNTTTVRSQFPYGGYDLEVGYNFEPCCRARLRGWAGYFNYSATHAPTLQGPRLRLQGELDDLFGCGGTRLTLGGIWQWDHRRKSCASALLQLRLPLGGCATKCKCYSSICRRMGDPIHRRPAILVRDHSKLAVTTCAGQILFFEEEGRGSGSQSDPTNLAEALSRAKPGDVLFGLNTKGAVNLDSLPAGTAILKDQQQLHGFIAPKTSKTLHALGTTFEVTDLTGAGQVCLIVPGGCGNGVQLANGNLVDGIAIGGINAADGGANGIAGFCVVGATIQNVTIANTLHAGIALQETQDVTINKVACVNTCGSGMIIENARAIFLDEISIINPGDTGIHFAGNGQDVVCTNCSVAILQPNLTNIVFDAVTRLTMSDTTLTNGGSGGTLLAIAGSGDYALSTITANLTVTGSQYPISIALTDPVGPLTLTDLTMDNPVGASTVLGAAVQIRVSGGSLPLAHLVAHNTIVKPGGDGLLIQSDSTNNDSWTIADNKISGTGLEDFAGNGLLITRSNSTAVTSTRATLDGNAVLNPGGNGIEIDDGGTVADTLIVTLTNNRVVNSGGMASYYLSTANTATCSLYNAIVQNNTASGLNAGYLGFVNGSLGTLRVMFVDNTSANPTGIELDNFSEKGRLQTVNGVGTFLQSANPNVTGTITFMGTITDMTDPIYGP